MSPKQASSPSACAATRQRVLEAASAVFAEHGYYRATVREICQRAEANIAAINYHFGDKERLYLEVLRNGARTANAKYPMIRLNVPPEASARERLGVFIHTLLQRIFDPDRVATYGRLMAREMVEPTPALDILVREVFRPTFDLLRGIVRELLGPRASESQVHLCSRSIIGQCVFYNHCRLTLERLNAHEESGPVSLDQLAEHITRFSLGALEALAHGQPAAADPR